MPLIALCLAGCGSAPSPALAPLAPLAPLATPQALCSGNAPTGVASAMLIITHEQRQRGVRPVHLVYALDGSVVFNRTDAVGVVLPTTVFHGLVAAGQHTLTFFVALDGGGSLRARHTFSSPGGASQAVVPDLEGDRTHPVLLVRELDCVHPGAAPGAPESDLTIDLP